MSDSLGLSQITLDSFRLLQFFSGSLRFSPNLPERKGEKTEEKDNRRGEKRNERGMTIEEGRSEKRKEEEKAKKAKRVDRIDRIELRI